MFPYITDFLFGKLFDEFPYEAMRTDFKFVAQNIASTKVKPKDEVEKYKPVLINLIGQFSEKWNRILIQRDLLSDWPYACDYERKYNALIDQYKRLTFA